MKLKQTGERPDGTKEYELSLGPIGRVILGIAAFGLLLWFIHQLAMISLVASYG